MKNRLRNSAHCTTRAHCLVCRAKTPAGEAWRLSVAKVFEDVEGADWQCPEGFSWGLAERPAPAPAQAAEPREKVRANVKERYEALKAALADGKAAGLPNVAEIAELLRVTDAALALHGARLGPCWQKRQRERVLRSYDLQRLRRRESA